MEYASKTLGKSRKGVFDEEQGAITDVMERASRFKPGTLREEYLVTNIHGALIESRPSLLPGWDRFILAALEVTDYGPIARSMLEFLETHREE